MKRAQFALVALALAACNSDSSTAPSAADEMSLDRVASEKEIRLAETPETSSGVVYTLSNQASGNAVLAYIRSANGALTPAGSFATGGNGTGAGLGTQNALVLTSDSRLLFAVNAGSNTVSSFRVGESGLQLVSTIASGGVHPVSLTAANGLLYVLNDGGNGNIAGLRYTANGTLSSIPNSTQSLSSAASAPAQIEFTPNGNRLIVTEKGTNKIATYAVTSGGLALPGAFTPSAGQTPFGFAFRGDVLIVSEAFGGAPDASTVSSYATGGGQLPSVVSGVVPTTETAACWVVVTQNGKFAYATNTGSGTVTGFAIASRGTLSSLNANGETAVLGAGTAPTDMALSRNSRYLYVLNSGTHTISTAGVSADGSLVVYPTRGVAGLPNGTVGLAAR
jgi:6-phosphogluconolactonase